MNNLKRLTNLVEGDSYNDSYLHGPQHWRCVSKLGVQLALANGGDPELAFLFGLFHDAAREHDGDDPDHGYRAAQMVADYARRGLLKLSPDRLKKLIYACENHTDDFRHDDPTIGSCYDADRLHLWRVGITPDIKYLSTDAARNFDMIESTYGLHDEPLTWDEVIADVPHEQESREVVERESRETVRRKFIRC